MCFRDAAVEEVVGCLWAWGEGEVGAAAGRVCCHGYGWGISEAGCLFWVCEASSGGGSAAEGGDGVEVCDGDAGLGGGDGGGIGEMGLVGGTAWLVRSTLVQSWFRVWCSGP